MNKATDTAETTTVRRDLAGPQFAWDDSVRHIVVGEIASLPPGERMDWIRNDQRDRWQKGLRLPIEAYLTLPPLADADEDLVMDLVYSEFILRQEMNEQPTPEDFVKRFPTLERPLRQLFAVDTALMEALTDLESEPQPPMGELAPSSIGKYAILGVLAEGGQGVVYRALHPTLSKEVVIKWSKEPITHAGDRDHLISEGQLLARIDHPNLVRVFDLDFHEGRPFLVMEFVEGLNLEQYRDRVHPTPREAAGVVVRIARALDVVHRKGIIHRDIKPKNILIDDKGQPKLIDFGLASWRHSFTALPTKSDYVSGTLGYISPEQARAQDASIGPRSDVFCLAGVLYYLLTGKAPYRKQDSEDLYTATMRGQWDRATLNQTATPAPLRAICAKALSANPQDRHASALALAEDLEAWIRRPQRVVRWSAVAALVLCTCVFAGWIAMRTTDPPVEPGKNQPDLPLVPSQLAVEVVRKKNGKSFPLEDAFPVVTGNLLRMSVRVPPNRHGSLFLLSEGKWTLLRQFEAEKAARLESFPPEVGTRVPVTGEPGTEVLVFCARRQGPIDLAAFQAMLPKLAAFPEIPGGGTFVTFNEEGLKSWDRGLGDPVKGDSAADVAQRQLGQLRDAIRVHCDVYAGVLFGHKDPSD